ncbi:MAG TPA: hypothetical protein VI248_10695 [Kineosporiaceae bacterium]
MTGVNQDPGPLRSFWVLAGPAVNSLALAGVGGRLRTASPGRHVQGCRR